MLNHYFIFTYHWLGFNSEEVYLEGEIRAANVSFAKAQLMYLGIRITQIRCKKFFLPPKKILTQKLRIQFTQQLADLVGAGISMKTALSVLEKSFPSRSAKTLFWLIRSQIESGKPLSEVLYLFSREFNVTYCQLLRISEESGELEKTLRHLVDLEKKQWVIKNKLKKASFYPLLVLLLSLFIISFLLFGIVPKFAAIFNQANLHLPWLTWMLMQTSIFLLAHSILIIFCAVVIFSLGAYFFATSQHIQRVIWRILLLFPWLGSRIQWFFLARFSYNLSLLLGATLPLTQSIELLLKSTKNPLQTESLNQIANLVSQGYALSHSLKTGIFFNDFMVYTIKIGEESGRMVESLAKIANFYESEIDRLIDNMSIFLEPVLMVILGLIMGVFIVALYLPIFNLGYAV